MTTKIDITPRQRVLTTLQHKEPDRVPLYYRDVLKEAFDLSFDYPPK